MVKRYLLYHLRWQASAVIMAPVMWALEAAIPSNLIRLILASAFGAAVFYMIDRRIFGASSL